MRKQVLFLICLSFFFLNPLSVLAKEPQDRVAFSIGGYDLIDKDNPAFDFRAEWHLAYKLYNLFHPFIGVELTSDGGVYGLIGLLWDYKFKNNWFATPSIGAGLYKDGDGINLGHTIQFRSQFEAGYEFGNGHRLSAAFSHISNAGLSDHNPGTEIIGVYYSIPFDWFK